MEPFLCIKGKEKRFCTRHAGMPLRDAHTMASLSLGVLFPQQ